MKGALSKLSDLWDFEQQIREEKLLEVMAWGGEKLQEETSFIGGELIPLDIMKGVLTMQNWCFETFL